MAPEPEPDLVAVRGMLDATLTEAQRHTRADLVARLGAERERLDRPACTVLVIGEFNKGKSSLVNALLNVRVCATDADVATAVPTVVRYADELCAGTRTDGAGELTAVAPEAVEGLVTGSAAQAVEVGLPRGLLREGLVLVDTPGMGGGLNSAHAAATLRALVGADAVVFVTDASQELTASEVELLRRAGELCPRLAVALTKTDFYPEWRRILELDAAHLRRAGLEVEVLPLSAPLRHHAVRAGDRVQSAESGFPRLAAFLRGTGAAVRRSAAAGAAAAAHSALSQLLSQVSTEHDALVDPDRQQTRLTRWSEAKQRAEELRGGAARWQQTLADRIADMASAVDYDITVRLRGVRRDAVDRLAAAEPGHGWVDLEPWLHGRTNEALAEHLRLIRDQVDDVTDDVADRFGDAAWDLRVRADADAVGMQGTLAGEDTGLAALAAARASRAELGIAAARGGSAGVLVTHAVGLVVGLALPVTIPVTAVLAGVLGRVTWQSARTSQYRVLRAEAERAVAGYLDEVELRARKDSRDTVRRVQQHLRAVFGEHAAQLHTSAARNLDVLARAAREEQREDPERVGRAGTEVQRLRALVRSAGELVERLLGEPVGQPR